MRRLTWWFIALTLTACDGSTGPAGVPDAELNVVVQDQLAPPLVAARDSFWAKVGDGRELRLFYQGVPPTASGDEFLRFEVPGDGLYRKPDGSAFQCGPVVCDSILITVTVIDPAKFLFDFEPDGLRFNPDPSHAARLKVYYYHADHDFDGDGVVGDPDDDAIERELDLWRRAAPGDLWSRVGAVKFEALDELDANIFSFSQFAVAW